MDRLLFRCVDTLVDCCELERRAFNCAFSQSGLKWRWSEDQFHRLQKITGERYRISWFAEHVQGDPISCAYADKILWRKEQVLCDLLQSTVVPPLPGVLRLLGEAAEAQVHAVAAVSSRSQHHLITQSASHFNYSSDLAVELPVAGSTGTLPASIEFDIAMNDDAMSVWQSRPCIAVSSNMSKGRACITHFGEHGNPAVQLSGTTILNKGSASLTALLAL